MTPGEREELARAMCSDGYISRRLASQMLDAIAPIIERLVAERVAAETERCAGIAREHDDPPTTDYGQGWRDAAQSIFAAIGSATR